MKNIYLFLVLLLAIGHNTRGVAQATTEYFYTSAGTTYTQDFDGLTKGVTVIDLSPSSGTLAYNLADAPMSATNLLGWQVQQVSGSGVPQYGANTGSSSAGRCYSYGAAAPLNANRSLGLLAGSTFRGRIGMIITNNTGQILTSFQITCTGKQWRTGNPVSQQLTFKYKITVNGNTINQTSYTLEPNLDIVTPVVNSTGAALDGDNSANQTTKSYRVSGITWPIGQRLAIAWDDVDDSGNDAGMAIDDFTFRGDTDITIPVELDNLTAKAKGATNEVAWTTVSEINNAQFSIERSANGQDFTPIGTVKGNGTTQVRNTYTFADEAPLSKSYYRLRQTDFNGKETTSKTVAVARDKGGLARFYPSVTKGDVTIELPNEAPATVIINNTLGQVVFTQTGLVGTNSLNISHLAAGTYFVTIKQTGIQTMSKLVKE
jgi:hypothetical protein